MILNIWTNRSEQTVETQIRLLLKEQSDPGLHCLPFHLHLLDTMLYGNTHCSIFRIITAFFGCSNYLDFYCSGLSQNNFYEKNVDKKLSTSFWPFFIAQNKVLNTFRHFHFLLVVKIYLNEF